MDRDEVAGVQQLFLGDVDDARVVDGLWNGAAAVRQHVHAHALRHDAEALADAAVAVDAEALAHQLDALAVGFLLPLAVSHRAARDGDIARAGEHVRQRQLRHRLGGRVRRVAHLNAVHAGVVHVDVVHADAAADDAFELAALRRVDVLLAHLGLGAHDHHVHVPQRRAQLARLIELLDDLVAALSQRFDGGLVHPVRNENTHSKKPSLSNLVQMCQECSSSNFFRNATSASAPSLGMALYTLARRPPTLL